MFEYVKMWVKRSKERAMHSAPSKSTIQIQQEHREIVHKIFHAAKNDENNQKQTRNEKQWTELLLLLVPHIYHIVHTQFCTNSHMQEKKQYRNLFT